MVATATSTGHVRHQVSFCAYFPSEAPKYSCIAVIRRPSSQFSAGGGVMAAPIIRKIAESLLALEDPIPLDSLRRSSSPKAYTKEIAAGRASALLAVMAQLGMPTPRMPRMLGSSSPSIRRYMPAPCPLRMAVCLPSSV